MQSFKPQLLVKQQCHPQPRHLYRGPRESLRKQQLGGMQLRWILLFQTLFYPVHRVWKKDALSTTHITVDMIFQD
jgi:hypothetical protein